MVLFSYSLHGACVVSFGEIKFISVVCIGGIYCFVGAPYEAFSAAMAQFMHTLMATGTLSTSLQVCYFYFVTSFRGSSFLSIINLLIKLFSHKYRIFAL